METNKIMQVKFPNGETYHVPTEVIIYHYATNIIMDESKIVLDDALAESRIYFREHPEQIIEYATNAMGWIDFFLVAVHVNFLSIEGKIDTWPEAEKEIVKPENCAPTAALVDTTGLNEIESLLPGEKICCTSRQIGKGYALITGVV